MDQHLRIVRALEVNGRVEGSRLDARAIVELFGTIAHQVADARAQLSTFAALRVVAGGGSHRDAHAIRRSIVGAASHVAALAGRESAIV